MVVGVRHVVVGTLGVAAVVKGGIWLLDSTIADLQMCMSGLGGGSVQQNDGGGLRWKQRAGSTMEGVPARFVSVVDAADDGGLCGRNGEARCACWPWQSEASGNDRAWRWIWRR